MNLNEAKEILNKNGFILEGAGAEGFYNYHVMVLKDDAIEQLKTALEENGIEYEYPYNRCIKVNTDDGDLIITADVTKRTISSNGRAYYTVRGKTIRNKDFYSTDEVIEFIQKTQKEVYEEMKVAAQNAVKKFWDWWKEVKELPFEERKFNDTFTKEDRKTIYDFINASDHDWEAIVPAKYVEFINNKLYYLK